VNRRERARLALAGLRQAIPRPETELHYLDPYELIVATILSAQCTDERVNRVTPALFAAYPTVQALAAADPAAVFPFIKSVSYPNNKAKHLVGMAKRVCEAFGGEVPSEIEALVTLPGVGRKTAQVVASVAFEVDALPVDTHVFRVANRIGLVAGAKTPLHVEQQLKALLDRRDWSEAHHLLILHGRYTCLARSPRCAECPIREACLYDERRRKLPASLEGLDPSQGAYYCKTRRHYFDEPAERPDRHGSLQPGCPRCGSMNVFEARTGRTLRRVPDFRV
jgi:endonuclease-3